MPLSQTLLLHIFPKREHAAAMGIWAMTTLLAPITGPVLGGYLCDSFGWPWIFWVNVPLTAAMAPLLYVMLKKQETATRRLKVDGVGLMLLVLWVGALQLMLDLGKEHDWFESQLICSLGVVALIGFAAFLMIADARPVARLALAYSRSNRSSLVRNFVVVARQGAA